MKNNGGTIIPQQIPRIDLRNLIKFPTPPGDSDWSSKCPEGYETGIIRLDGADIFAWFPKDATISLTVSLKDA